MQKLLRLSDLSFRPFIGGLLLLYVFSTALLELPLYAGWQHRLQIPELVFAIIIPFGLFAVWRNRISFAWNHMDLAVGLYLLANLISALWNNQTASWLELLGKGYLIGVYLLFKMGLHNHWINRQGLVRILQILAATLVLLIISAYVLLYLGMENNLLARYADYPYFGTVYRAKALLQTPSMYISLVNWCLIFILADSWQRKQGRSAIIWLIILGGIALLSFSKALMLTGFAVLLLRLFYYRPVSFWKAVLPITLVCGLLYFVLTNFVYLVPGSSESPANTYLAGEETVAARNGGWMPTSYLALKNAAITMGASAPIVGVGPGYFLDRLKAEKAAGRYSQHLPLHDPHSIYLGAWAETGALGALSILLLLGATFQQIKKIERQSAFYAFFLVWLLVFVLEGMNTDLMNFRHYWVQFGLISGCYPMTDP